MGCDIHATCQQLVGKTWLEEFEIFDFRHYGIYGFLADVRNYSDVPPLDQPRGYPPDLTVEFDMDRHSASWFTLDELLKFDYSKSMEDRRVTIGNNGGCTATPGRGKMTTFKEFLGDHFFNDLEKMKQVNSNPSKVRVVFDFDN